MCTSHDFAPARREPVSRGPVSQQEGYRIRFLAAITAALACATAAGAATETVLHHREHRQTVSLHRWTGTVRFFRHHRWLVRARRTRPIALRELRRAHVWIRVIRRELAETRAQLLPRSVPEIICAVFASQCGKALSVAFCESRYDTAATNGQYFGVFQMGWRERARFGGSSLDPWEQIKAAYAYWRVAGWAPWECA
jgi:hypothetical protein